MGKEDGLAFRVVKKLLEALYLLSLIAIVWFGIILYKAKTEADPQLSPEQREQTKLIFVVVIILLVISFICSIIAMYGILKENKCIIITMTVFSAIGVIINIVGGKIAPAVVGLLITILTGVFAYMITQKEKKNAQNAPNPKV